MKEKSLFEPLLIETAWEVCNKVGGIYTVIQSKVPFISDYCQDNYCLVGPLTSDDLPFEFKAYKKPKKNAPSVLNEVVNALNKKTTIAHIGDWLVQGKPRVILLDIKCTVEELTHIRAHYAQYYGIPFNGDPLVDKVIVFAYRLKLFFEQLAKFNNGNQQIIGHFHEWMASAPILDIKRQELPINTVFTTHATALGRYMAGNESNFYEILPSVDWKAEAYKYNIEPQAWIEHLVANDADILSTVSGITDKECEFLLGRKADIILPNGLNVKRFEALHEFQNLHLEYKRQINEFVMSHFFGSYTFDLDNTLYFFTSGRYEFVNKGFDVTLKALNILNEKMKTAKINKTIVMFYITKRPFDTINPMVMEMRALVDELKKTSESIVTELVDKIFYEAAKQEENEMPDLNALIDESWRFRFRKTLQAFKSHNKYLPLVVTHNLKNDQDDELLQSIRNTEFFNQADNPVKLIYHPDFVDSTNPLFKLDYSEFVRGCHLGVFPSYYEPWGYTPVECIVRGVPTVTSDLSGFGDFAKVHIPNSEDKGVFVLRRRNKGFDESAESLANYLFEFVQQDRRDRITQRNQVEQLSESFAWDKLGHYYLKAYQMAIQK